jgi:outer membrane lipoprotein-sorting protein
MRPLLGGVVLVSALAQSVPPSGEAIVRAMHDRYASSWYHTLTFTQKTTLRSPADTMVMETWKESAVLPGRLRIDIQRATGPVTAMFKDDSLYLVRRDSVVRRTANHNILLVIGFDVYTQPVEKTLSELAGEKFPMTPVREDTWQGRQAYVIGSPAHQLWIDKDRLVFERLLQPMASDSTKVQEIRFDGYTRVPGGWVATDVSAFIDGKLMQHEQYSDVHPNAAVDPSVFALPSK